MATRTREPSAVDLAAVARACGGRVASAELRAIYAAALEAVHHGGVDPLLALSYVLWPSERVREAQRDQRAGGGASRARALP